MNNYYRVKAHFEKEKITAVFDSNGCFEKLWQFSAFIIAHGGTILDVQKDEQMTDTYTRMEENAKKIFLREVE